MAYQSSGALGLQSESESLAAQVASLQHQLAKLHGHAGRHASPSMAAGDTLSSAAARRSSAGGGKAAAQELPEDLFSQKEQVADSFLPLQVLTQAVTSEQLPQAQPGGEQAPVPQAGYLLGRGMAQLGLRWETEAGGPAEAVRMVRDGLTSAMQMEVGLPGRLYWLGVALATAGALDAYGRVLRRKPLQEQARALACEPALHLAVGEVVQQQLPVHPELAIAVDEQGRTARDGRRGRHREGEQEEQHQAAMVEAWQRLQQQLDAVLQAVAAAGLSWPAQRGLVRLVLQLLDAGLLNQMLLHRNACAKSSILALQQHLGALMRHLLQGVASWHGEKADIEWGFRRTIQALRYLGHVKEDLARKVKSGLDMQVECARRCKDLSVAQVFRLTQHHWDDWSTPRPDAAVQGETWGLLEALRRAEYATLVKPVDGVPLSNGTAIVPVTTPQGWMSIRNDPHHNTDLVVDGAHEFVLEPRIALTAATLFLGRAGGPPAQPLPPQQALQSIQMACALMPVPPTLRIAGAELAFLQSQPHPAQPTPSSASPLPARARPA